MNLRNLELIIIPIRSGQPRPYADAENVVRIQNGSAYDFSDETIEKVIPIMMEEYFPPRRGTPIDSTEELKKLGKDVWEWKQVLPFTD